LSLIEIFSSAYRRAGIPVKYTKGFNPIVKMEFASPLSTGISAEREFAAVDFNNTICEELFIQQLNKNLPKGVFVNDAKIFFIATGMKKYSLSSLLWGFSYRSAGNHIDFVKAVQEKTYRKTRCENENISFFSLRRSEVLARNITGSSTDEWISYYDAYRFLYS
jgi:radical SAM-linked protein